MHKEPIEVIAWWKPLIASQQEEGFPLRGRDLYPKDTKTSKSPALSIRNQTIRLTQKQRPCKPQKPYKISIIIKNLHHQYTFTFNHINIPANTEGRILVRTKKINQEPNRLAINHRAPKPDYTIKNNDITQLAFRRRNPRRPSQKIRKLRPRPFSFRTTAN